MAIEHSDIYKIAAHHRFQWEKEVGYHLHLNDHRQASPLKAEGAADCTRGRADMYGNLVS